jgi:hypothetical protein
MLRSLQVLLLAGLTLALAAPALASTPPVPSALYSTVPATIIGSPDGAFATNIVVRAFPDIPIPDADVMLYFGGCSGFSPCPNPCTGCTSGPLAQSLHKFADSGGAVSIDLRMGASGCPNPPTMQVYAFGVLIGSPRFVSLDQDGDLGVTAGDVAIVHALIGVADLRADLNGDGSVTAADEAIVAAHVGANCSQPTPTWRSTWGKVKSIYR